MEVEAAHLVLERRRALLATMGQATMSAPQWEELVAEGEEADVSEADSGIASDDSEQSGSDSDDVEHDEAAPSVPSAEDTAT